MSEGDDDGEWSGSHVRCAGVVDYTHKIRLTAQGSSWRGEPAADKI